jgi:DNA-3-methyladenine glycosylase
MRLGKVYNSLIILDKMESKDFSDAEQTARKLLGKVLARKVGGKILKAKIVETEAYYGKTDPASRACKNGDLKETMEMEAGTILVYGVHNNWLINFVTGEKGNAEAVLLRALEPMNFEGNLNGPGLLTKSLEIKKEFHKKNIFDCGDMWIEEGEEVNKKNIVESKRIGVSKDLDKNLRFYIKDNKFVSRR